MFRKIIIISCFLTSFFDLLACGVCSSNASALFNTFSINENKNYIGINYSYIHFHDKSTHIKYRINTFQGKFGLLITESTSLHVLMPFQNYFAENLQSKIKLSDCSAMINQTIGMHSDSAKKLNIVFSFQAGIKFPTGKYVKDVSNQLMVGSGSIDFIGGAVLESWFANFGNVLSVSYKKNTNNKLNYKFGNQLVANMSIMHKNRIGQQLLLLKTVSLKYQHQQKDISNGYYRLGMYGGGYFYSVGLQIKNKKHSFGFDLTYPIYQHFANNTITFNQINNLFYSLKF